MRIYVGHSKDINYIENLYKPIRELEKEINQVFVLPHENDSNSKNTREFYNEFDLFIAEVSLPATGLGIELGWAYDSKVPVVCIYKKDQKYSSSLKAITNEFYEYETNEELMNLLKMIIDKNKKI